MRCLWLTLADPDPPTNGQFLYSAGLIRAAAGAGAELDVVGLTRPGASRADGVREGLVHWYLAAHHPRPKWQSLLSPMPHMVHRTDTDELRRKLHRLLRGDQWDAIVFDNLSPAWALASVRKAWPDRHHRPQVIYLAHNHEASVTARIARLQPSWWKRWIERWDAVKVARIEQSLAAEADLITANTPEDCALYRARWPDKPIEFLPPGYDGPYLARRRIDSDTPRRAIVLGSFDWLAKRTNLEQFLAAADPLFAAAGAELQVVGSAEEAFLDRLRRQATATHFTGRVDDVVEHLRQARVAIVPERAGGGFKLKVLDYVFNRVPIVALVGSVPGTPLRHGESVLLYPDAAALARGALDLIDDFATLNSLQSAAYDACRDAFEWSSRGRHLLAQIGCSSGPDHRLVANASSVAASARGFHCSE